MPSRSVEAWTKCLVVKIPPLTWRLLVGIAKRLQQMMKVVVIPPKKAPNISLYGIIAALTENEEEAFPLMLSLKTKKIYARKHHFIIESMFIL